jgi:uncharacterized protein
MTSFTPADPWYRHFWPWFILAMLAGAVTGSFVSLYLALHHSDVVLEHADSSQ